MILPPAQMIKKNSIVGHHSIQLHGHSHSITPLHGNHGIDSNTIRDSMQYYRVWIYSCNSVLGVTSAIFTVFAAFVLADVRLSLLRDVELYHPTFLYAYTALILQCGVIQAIGCLGAQRLNHKLLSIYWVLLLLLTIGDVVVGLVWVFKLEKVRLTLRPALTADFLTKYSADPSFTEVWDGYQETERCCGVNGPQDFSQFPTRLLNASADPPRFLMLPDSCCTLLPPRPVKRDLRKLSSSENLTSGEPALPAFAAGGVRVRHFVSSWKKRPLSWGSGGWNGTGLNDTLTDPEPDGSSEGPEETSEVSGSALQLTCRRLDLEEVRGSSHRRRHAEPNSKYVHSLPQATKAWIRVYRNGCAGKVLAWLNHVSGLLFILGFCIIGFIKAFFLFILRYEIREMIEKIHILETDGKDGGGGGSRVVSPSRSRGGSLGGNTLLKQYSTQSNPHPNPIPPFTGITIKGPAGDGGCANHVHHHHIHGAGARGTRRPSARSLGEGIRSNSHSQETVNMTLLITASQEVAGEPADGAENISLKVPTPEEREAKRSNFANYAWDSNVSGDSSASGAYYEHCCCPPEAGATACAHHVGHPPRTELVHVDLETCCTSSSFEERSSQGSGQPNIGHTLEPVVAAQGSELELTPLNWLTGKPEARLTLERRNGNNNTSIDLDSDFVMALIGTAV